MPDLTWTCGDNCWVSQGGSTFIMGEGGVVYHQWLCCPWEKWVKEAPTISQSGGPVESVEMKR